MVLSQMQLDNVICVCVAHILSLPISFPLLLLLLVFYLTLGYISGWPIKIDTAVHFALTPFTYTRSPKDLFFNADREHANIIDYIYLNHI